jgi:hypothetical protein
MTAEKHLVALRRMRREFCELASRYRLHPWLPDEAKKYAQDAVGDLCGNVDPMISDLESPPGEYARQADADRAAYLGKTL